MITGVIRQVGSAWPGAGAGHRGGGGFGMVTPTPETAQKGQLKLAHRPPRSGLMRWRTRRTLPMACTPAAASTSAGLVRVEGGIRTDGARRRCSGVARPDGRLGDVDQGFDGRVARGAVALGVRVGSWPLVCRRPPAPGPGAATGLDAGPVEAGLGFPRRLLIDPSRAPLIVCRWTPTAATRCRRRRRVI